MKDSTRQEIKELLEEIEDKQLIRPRGNKISFESIIESDYEAIDYQFLCDLLADNNFDWRTSIDEYLEIMHPIPEEPQLDIFEQPTFPTQLHLPLGEAR